MQGSVLASALPQAPGQGRFVLTSVIAEVGGHRKGEEGGSVAK